VLFGIGAMLGPLADGRLADRVGFAAALRLAFFVEAACAALLAVSTQPWSLTISSFVIGAMAPGVVPLVLGRVPELIPDDADQQRRGLGVVHGRIHAWPGGSNHLRLFLLFADGRRLPAAL
jgi:predicted MFS family arabinose efflux permease